MSYSSSDSFTRNSDSEQFPGMVCKSETYAYLLLYYFNFVGEWTQLLFNRLTVLKKTQKLESYNHLRQLQHTLNNNNKSHRITKIQ